MAIKRENTQQVIMQYMNSQVDPLLEELVSKIAIERPEDPGQWIAEYLLNSRQSPRLSSSTAARKDTQIPQPCTKKSPSAERKGGSLSSQTNVSEEKVEMDTAEAEDAYNLNELLLPTSPKGYVLPDSDKFSISYSQEALNGWVKQPSPCCAAASVAGAWNVVRGFHRKHEKAIGHADVLEIMREMLESQVREKQGRFTRMLGARSIEPLLQMLEQRLEEQGYPKAPKKKEAPTRRHLLRTIRSIVTEEAPKDESEDVFKLLSELYEEEGYRTGEDESNAGDKDDDDDDEKEDDEDQGSDSDEEVTDPEEVPTPSNQGRKKLVPRKRPTGGNNNALNSSGNDEEESPASASSKRKKKLGRRKSSTAGKKSSWHWKRDLLELLNKIKGVNKLCAERPSTAAIGNWGITSAISRLSDADYELPYAIKGKPFVGRKRPSKVKLDIALSKKDDAKAIAAQWAALRSAFLQEETALIFHLKNHYALVFALRESTESLILEDGTIEKTTQRELLTARRGQRPTAWISWSEARNTMLNWDGYKIIKIQSQK